MSRTGRQTSSSPLWGQGSVLTDHDNLGHRLAVVRHGGSDAVPDAGEEDGGDVRVP